MKIGISLITYNDLVYLKPCLESLFRSDLNKHEYKLFICDNGSDIEMCEYLSNLNINKYIIFNSKNEGIVIPRIKVYNEIIKETFDLLLEIHSDMLFPKIWLEPLIEIDDNETLILQPHIYQPKNIITIDELESRIKQLKYSKIYNKCRQVHPWLIKLKYVNIIGGYYDENFSPQECDDDDFVYRTLLNNFKIKSTGESWVCHYGGKTRHKVLSSNLAQHLNYFEKKHGIKFSSLLKMFEYHPQKYE